VTSITEKKWIYLYHLSIGRPDALFSGLSLYKQRNNDAQLKGMRVGDARWIVARQADGAGAKNETPRRPHNISPLKSTRPNRRCACVAPNF